MNAITPIRREDRAPHDRVQVLWVYQDTEGYWRFRREGDDADRAYLNRCDAVIAARLAGQETGAYKLHLQLAHGRFALELLNTGVQATPCPGIGRGRYDHAGK